jgi:hypothetical protein
MDTERSWTRHGPVATGRGGAPPRPGALSLRPQRLPPSWTPALAAPWVSAARGEGDELAAACGCSFACSPVSAVFELVLVVVSVLAVSVSPASFSPASLSAASVSECEAECVVSVLSLVLVLVGVIVATAAVARMGEEVALGVLAAGLGSGVAAGVSAARTVADVGAACRVVPIAAAAAAPPITSAPAAATAVVLKVLKGFMGLLAQWRPVAGSGRESPPPLAGIRASGDL